MSTAEPALSPGVRRLAAGRVLAAVALVAIAVATLTSGPAAVIAPRPPGLLGGEMELQDFVANVVLFLPFGLGIGVATGRMRRAVLVALLVSACIEAVQGVFLAGRQASVVDVVSNVIGGGIGGWIGTHAGQLFRPSRAAAWRLAAVGAVAAALVFAGTAWLMAPGAPSAEYEGQFSVTWWARGQRTPGVLDATIDGLPFQWDRVGAGVASEINRELSAGRVRVDARVVPGAPVTVRTRLVTVIEHERPEHLTLASMFVEQRDLLFSARSRADWWHLRSPWVRVRRVFPARGPDVARASPDDWAAGLITGRDTILLGGERDGRTLRVWGRGRTGGSEAVMTLTPAEGWMLFTPYGATPRSGEWALSALWSLVVLGPAVFWLVVAVWPRGATKRDAVG